MAEFHPTAIIAESAQIGAGTTVGPYSVIGSNVVIGRGNQIGSHVVIEGRTRLGDENRVFQFASVGAEPQDLKFRGEESTLEVGNKNIIREYVTLQPGTEGGGMITKIGSDNLFMACSHVGHDCEIGNGNVFANSAAISGHVLIGDGVIVGGLCGVHQFVRLGDLCFLGAGAMVSNDIAPYCMAQGDRAKLVGLNSVGLKRHGIAQDEIRKLQSCFKGVFLGPGVIQDKVQKLLAEEADFEIGQKFLNFIKDSERGVARPRGRTPSSEEE